MPLRATTRASAPARLLLAELRYANAVGDHAGVQERWIRSGRSLPEDGQQWTTSVSRRDWQLRLQLSTALATLRPESARPLLRSLAESQEPPGLIRAFAALHSGTLGLDINDLEGAQEDLQLAAHLITDTPYLGEGILASRLAIQQARLRRLATNQDPTQLRVESKELDLMISEFLAVWDRAGQEPDGIGFLQYPYRRELLVEAYRIKDAAHGPAAASAFLLRNLIACQRRGRLTRALDPAPFDEPEARARLARRNEGLMAFVPGRRSLLLLIYDRDGPLLVDLGPQSAALKGLRRLASDALHPPARREAAHWRKLAREAGEQLCPPGIRERILGWSRISFVQPELLGGLPLHLMHIEGIGVLALERPLTSYPSFQAWQSLERRAHWTPGPVDLCAVVSPALPAAKLARRQAHGSLLPSAPDAVKRPVSGRILHEHDATLDSLPDLLAGRDAALFWTHGVPSTRPGQGPGLELASSPVHPSGEVHATELLHSLAGIDFPDMVFLGICGAGRSVPRAGDDAATHLGGTFLELGASVVLASNRDVHARCAASLLDAVFADMPKGAPLADLLLEARRRAVKTPGWDHPHYWGSLQVFGLGHASRH